MTHGATAHFLGVDAGGSRSTFLLTNERLETLCRLEGGPINVATLGAVEAGRRLREQASQLLGRSSVRLAGIALAGARSADAGPALRDALRPALPGARIRITSDIEATLAAIETDPRPTSAIALIAGTGSIAAAWRHPGELICSGGLGFPRGDEGAGAWIGQQGLIAARAAWRGDGPPTLLADRLEQTDLADLDETASRLARLSPIVLRCAEQADPVCGEIVSRAAQHLADLALEVAARLDRPASSLRITLAGGLLRSRNSLRSAVLRQVDSRLAGARLVRLRVTPEVGAIRLALETEGWPLP